MSAVVVQVVTSHGVAVEGLLRADGVVDIGDRCTHCGCDTAPGSGSWVNRIPSGWQADADSPDLYGWMCADCQCMECDVCGESVLEWSGKEGVGIVCDDCC